MTDTVSPSFVRRPATVSVAVAVLAGVLAVWLVADTPLQRRALWVGAVGTIAFLAGARLWRRDLRHVGGALAAAGSLAVVVALQLAALGPPQFVHRFELVPALLGLWVLAAGVVPVRAGWERPLIDVGTGLLFVAVLTSGVVRGTSTTALVVAGAGTVLAWDAAENGVSVGDQLGVDARTLRAELVHVGATAAVAAAAATAVLGVAGLGVEGLSFAALAALLVAGVVLTLAYHR